MNADAIEADASQEDVIEIPLTKGYVAIIDRDDAHLAKLKWHAAVSTNGVVYAKRQRWHDGVRGSTYLHRAVMKFGPSDPLVDHCDGDGLNCRRRNLRPATKLQNVRNRAAPQAVSSSPYVGVSWNKYAKKWQARIRHNGSRPSLGNFDNLEDANRARLIAEKNLWGIEPRRAAAMSEIDAAKDDKTA